MPVPEICFVLSTFICFAIPSRYLCNQKSPSMLMGCVLFFCTEESQLPRFQTQAYKGGTFGWMVGQTCCHKWEQNWLPCHHHMVMHKSLMIIHFWKFTVGNQGNHMPGTSLAEVEEQVCKIQDIRVQDLLMFFCLSRVCGWFLWQELWWHGVYTQD
jgi:hypothetical protein